MWDMGQVHCGICELSSLFDWQLSESTSQGNDAYYLGDFSRALALYNEGLALDNNDGLLAANKTQALLKLER